MTCGRCKADLAPEALKDELCFDCTRTLLWSTLKALNRIVTEPNVDKTIAACEALVDLTPALSADSFQVLQYSAFHTVKGLTAASTHETAMLANCGRCLRPMKLDSLQQGLCLRCTHDLLMFCLDDLRDLKRGCDALANKDLKISFDPYYNSVLARIPSK